MDTKDTKDNQLTIPVSRIKMEPYPNWYEDIGRFASQCRDGGNPDPSRFKAIGMHCVDSKHYAATRPFMFRFDIEGISRVAAQQLLRHTVGLLPMMESGRHVDIRFNDVVVPPSVLKDERALGVWSSVVNVTKTAYNALVEFGIPMEDARMLTTQAETTRITLYLSFEAILNLYAERMCPHAQWEIRALVGKLYIEFIAQFPELTEKFMYRCDSFGKCLEKKGCGRWITE